MDLMPLVSMTDNKLVFLMSNVNSNRSDRCCEDVTKTIPVPRGRSVPWKRMIAAGRIEDKIWCRGPESNWLRPPFQGGALPVSYPGTETTFLV